MFLNAQNLDELIEVVGQRIAYYNTERRHSSIGYVSPATYIERVRAGWEK
ncbi:MAG: transposase [Anaerolineae bacterium]|nr:transposase [Anaerolineae bacterium]